MKTGGSRMYQVVVTGIALGISSYTDLKYQRIYTRVLLPYFLLVVLGNLIGGTASLAEMGMGVLPGAFCLVISWVSRQSLGYGDSLLILICGVSLGFWPCIWVAFTAFFWAGIWALAAHCLRGAKRTSEFPFVPFLLLGFVIQWIGGF
jgi:leader peptidase (prepilin peptidase)/N-methyltransferase